MKAGKLEAAALAAGVMVFVFGPGLSHARAGGLPPVGMVSCNLHSCYDERGNEVDRTTTGSIASQARGAVEAAAGEASAPAGARFGDIVARHASANGVPVDLAHAVIRIESNYRQNARGRAGEIGLMQIKPATARMMGFSGSASALFDPETNIRYGMKYLGKARQLGDGSVCATLLRYNAGHAATRMNSTSAAYCRKVKRQLGDA